MERTCAPKAQRECLARAPSGLRRLSLAMLATGKLAEGFSGAREGTAVPGQVLAAFKAAAPFLGFGPRVVHAIDWLFSFTQPQDWVEPSRPVVWPSAATQRDALGLGASQVKTLNRLLVELGLVTMKDSPNGKRYGRRDAQKRIVEAYGFDLSPLAARKAEFVDIAAKGREEREQMRRLRRRATIARNGLLQILETVAEQDLYDASWRVLEEEGMALARSLQKVERLKEMALGIASLEQRQLAARERLENPLATISEPVSEDVNSDPRGPENRPHNTTTKNPLNPEQDTVIPSEGRNSPRVERISIPNTPVSSNRPYGAETGRPARTDNGTVMRMLPDELVRLAPRLRPYLHSSAPSWSEVVDAASWLCHDLGVSKFLWGEACLAMSREAAAIALAIVSEKSAAHFTSSPGGYFHGMVAKAKTGQLNLARTVWALRRAAIRLPA
jgi:replication initiation protein RepC